LLLLQRAFFVRGLVAQAKDANGFMADTLESCRGSMGVKRKIGLKVSANATSPAVCGLFRPVILVPQNLTSSLSKSQLRAVLLHELAHIKRGDLWMNLVQTVLQIIYFYNPLLWLANCVIRRVREQAVDEMVLVTMGEAAQQYPQTLVNVAKLAFKRPALSLRLIGVVESKSALAGRIKHILNRPMPRTAKLGIVGVLAVFIAAAILLPMAKSSGLHESRRAKALTKILQEDSNQKRGNAAKEFTERIDNEEITNTSAGKVLRAITSRIKKHPKTADRQRTFDSYPKVYWEELGLGFELIVNDKVKKDQTAAFLQALELVGCSYGVESDGVFRLFGQLYIPRKDILINYKLRTLSLDGKSIESELLSVFPMAVGGNLSWGRETMNKLDLEGSLGLELQVVWYQIPDSIVENLPAAWRDKDDFLKDMVKNTLTRKLCEYTKKIELSQNSNWQGIFSEDFSNNNKETTNFSATLPNGVTVELVGICEHPSEGKQWWKPDGSLLGQSPVRNIDVGGYNIRRGEAAYELVAKLTGPETLLSRSSTPEKWKVSQARKVGLGKSGTAKDKSGKSCLRATTAIVKNGLEKIDIEFGLAGVWEKKLTISSNESSKQKIQDTGVVINPPYEKDSNATITIKIPNKIDSRMAINIIAVLKNGKVIDSAARNRNSKIRFMRSTDNYEFHGVNLSDVDHFEIYTSKYQWVKFKNVSLKPNFKADVQVGVEPVEQKEQAADLGIGSNYAWQRTDRYVAPDPDGFFPDDPEAGKRLDILFNAVDRDRHPDEEILTAVRHGFRRTTKHRTLILRWIGNKYIWNKKPQNPEAIEIMYHAVPMERHYAVYFGLSVVQPKTPNILRTLAEICVQGEDVGRITWGIRSQREELVSYIKPYLRDEDAKKREIASMLLKHFNGEIDFEKWKREKLLEQKTDVQIEGKERGKKNESKWISHSAETNKSPGAERQIVIEARVFSIKTPNTSIPDYLYSKLGIKNVNTETPLMMPVQLTNEQADEFEKWASAIPGTTTLVSPKVTAANGELIDLSLTTQHELIMSYKKPEDSSGKPEPVFEKFTTGVKLGITPELQRDGKAIVLKLAFSKNDLVRVKKGLNESGYEIELPVLNTVAVNTNVIVASGKNTLVPVAGLFSTGKIEAGGKPIQQILLLVKTTILNLASGLQDKPDVQVEVEKHKEKISGFVEDENGSPIGGASATLLNKDLVLLPKPIKLGETMRLVISDHYHNITDTNGYFEFVDLNPGKTDISVKANGYRTEILREITTGTENLRITLGKPSAYRLAGEVVDGKGNPISGVEITLAGESYTTVRTNEKGSFRFAGKLEPTTVHRARVLFAKKEGFGVWGKTLDTTGGETYVMITLLPEEKISGRVVDQIGKPIANATILFWSCGGRDTTFSYTGKWQEIAPKTRTDANGEFTLACIPTESDVSLRASAPGYASRIYSVKTGEFGSYAVRRKDRRTTIVHGSTREPEETIEFKLQRAVTLRGTLVYGDSGRPAPGLRIATQSHKRSHWAETKTDQAGLFELEGVSPNPCNLLVFQEDLEKDSPPEWTAAAIEFDDLQEGETRGGIRLVLTKGGVIRGKTFDAQGNPLHGIDIAFYSAARPRSGAACQHTNTAKDGSWAYRFPPGEVYVYILTKRIPGVSWSRPSYTLYLKDGQEIDNIDFELSQAVPENSPYRR
ncbi:MAG: carboxypeptidase regulatory-like domain-containing protein, partial [Planctomycetes bacterium]|nr:carboxypeptidase regulatory-like domain-containing protein [Planctomycetota bacterium]